VILVNYNGREWTLEALDSIAAQGYPSVETIVVDSGSSDGSPDLIESWMSKHPEVRGQLLRCQENVGFAVGCNLGFERSRGELIFLLNNDATLGPGVLARVDQAARDHPEAGSFMCSMRFADSPTTLNSTGIIVFWDASAMDRSWKAPLQENPPENAEVLGPCGGAAVWRREVPESIGLFDAEFFMYSEDVDLALRARRAGFACVYLPDAVVLHKGSLSAARAPHRPLMEIRYRNVLLTLVRNIPPAARARGWAMFFVRFATGLARYGWDDTHCRLFAIRFVVRHRKRLAQERGAIRSVGPDDRVVRWMFLTPRQHP
jgi:hypothetical protein